MLLGLKYSTDPTVVRHSDMLSADKIVDVHTQMRMAVVAGWHLVLAMLSHNGSLGGAGTFKAVTQNQDSILTFLPFAFKLQHDELIMNAQGHYTELERS